MHAGSEASCCLLAGVTRLPIRPVANNLTGRLRVDDLRLGLVLKTTVQTTWETYDVSKPLRLVGSDEIGAARGCSAGGSGGGWVAPGVLMY